MLGLFNFPTFKETKQKYYPEEDSLKRDRDEWKERAELAERKLAILTQTIHEAWKEVEK